MIDDMFHDVDVDRVDLFAFAVFFFPAQCLDASLDVDHVIGLDLVKHIDTIGESGAVRIEPMLHLHGTADFDVNLVSADIVKRNPVLDTDHVDISRPPLFLARFLVVQKRRHVALHPRERLPSACGTR